MVETERLPHGFVTWLGASAKRLAKVEFAAALLVFAVAFASLTAFKMARIDQLRGDSAMYFQGTENLARGGALASQVQASIVDFLNLNMYEDWTPAQFQDDPSALFARPAAAKERSLLLGHTYFILYPVALVARIVPVRTVLLSLYALSFCGVVLLVYLLLRRRAVPLIASLLFCVLVMSHPAWWEGFLFGQFYPDRLFILLGVLFMALASRAQTAGPRTANRAWLFVAAVACASINERGAIVAGLFLLLYVLLYWKKPGLDRYYKLALSIATLGYGLVALKMLLPTDQSYGSFLPRNVAGVIAVIHLPHFFPMVGLFAVMNAPLFILALFEWRAAVIAAVLMLPNIFGNIGGGEKVGWVTHYPTFFFAPLIWAAMTGYTTLWSRVGGTKRSPAALGATAVLIFLIWTVAPNSWNPIQMSLSNLSSSFVPTLAAQVQTYLLRTDTRQRLAQAADAIQRAIPTGTVVSSVEAGMPLLYGGRTIEFFPADIDNADYAVVGAQYVDGKIMYNGTVNFQSPEDRKKVDAIVQARMKRDGYDLDHPQFFSPAGGIAVVRRAH